LVLYIKINNTNAKDKVKNNDLYQKYKILKIADIYKFKLCKFMFLFHMKALPEIFENYFSSIDKTHNCNRRNKSSQNYFLNSVRTNSGKYSINGFMSSTLEWNTCRIEILFVLSF